MVWYYRWQDMKKNDLITVYSLCNKEDSYKKSKSIMEDDLKRLGIEVENLYMHKRWKYFPHVSGEDLKNGFYKELSEQQMKNNTLYGGELLDFANLEHCTKFSKYLANKYF